MNRAERRAAWRERHRAVVPGAVPGPGTPAGRSDVTFRIGTVALHGLPGLRRTDVADAVRAELTDRIVADGLPAPLGTPGRADRLETGAISVRTGARADAVGRQVAGAILAGTISAGARR